MRRKLLWLSLLITFVLPIASLAQTSLETIELENVPAYDIEVSPDGRFAAVYSGTFSRAYLGMPIIEYQVDPLLLPIRLIDTATGAEIARLDAGTDYVSSVAFSPDGQTLAAYHNNGVINLWNTADGVQTGQLLTMLGGHQVEFLGDQGMLVTFEGGSSAGELLGWDIASGAMTRIWRPSYASFGELQLGDGLTRLNYMYRVMDASPDGAWLATATPNGEVTLWDATSGEQTVIRGRAEEPGRFNVSQVSFSRDSRTLVYQYNDLGIQLWDIETQAETVTIPADNNARFALSPSGENVVWATRRGVWVAPVSDPAAAVSLLEIPESLRALAPTAAFISEDRVLIGSFAIDSDADEPNRIFILTLDGAAASNGSGWG